MVYYKLVNNPSTAHKSWWIDLISILTEKRIASGSGLNWLRPSHAVPLRGLDLLGGNTLPVHTKSDLF